MPKVTFKIHRVFAPKAPIKSTNQKNNNKRKSNSEIPSTFLHKARRIKDIQPASKSK